MKFVIRCDDSHKAKILARDLINSGTTFLCQQLNDIAFHFMVEVESLQRMEELQEGFRCRTLPVVEVPDAN